MRQYALALKTYAAGTGDDSSFCYRILDAITKGQVATIHKFIQLPKHEVLYCQDVNGAGCEGLKQVPSAVVKRSTDFDPLLRYLDTDLLKEKVIGGVIRNCNAIR